MLIIQNKQNQWKQQHEPWTRSFRFLFIVNEQATIDCTNSSGVVWVIWVVLLCFDENRFQVVLIETFMFERIESELLFRSLKSITQFNRDMSDVGHILILILKIVLFRRFF